MQAAKNGDLDIEERTPENAMSLAEEIRQLRSEVKRLNKENKRLQEERDFLNEAAIFDCYDLTAIGLSMDGNMIY